MIIAKEFHDSKKFIEAIKYGLSLELKTQFKSADEFTEYFLNLQYSLFSCSELKVYDDFLLIFDKYKNIVCSHLDTEPPSGYFNNAVFFQFRVNVLLYQYFKYSIISKNDLKQAIKDLEFWTSKLNDTSKFIEPNEKISNLVQEVLEDKNIYYTIDFKLPYHIQLADDDYTLTFDNQTIIITTQILKSDDLVSYNKDRYFSKITLKIHGFSNCDNYWKGASITYKENESSEILAYILEVMNYFILHIKQFDNTSKVHLLAPDDIGNITTNQYYSNGKHYHYALAMQFSGFTMVDVLSPTFINGDINNFKHQINENELLLYEELYSIALIDYQKEDYLSGFYIINSAMESMVEWYLKSYCYITANIEFHDNMMEGKSSCNQCKLYNKYKDELNTEAPIKANIPSLFTQIKFILRDIVNIDKNEREQITKLIQAIKQDSIRNDLTHGRKKVIKRNELLNSLDAFKQLEEKLEEYYQRIYHQIK